MNSVKEPIICPECGEKTYALLQHTKLHHPDIITKEDFKKYYPEYNGPLFVDRRKKGEYKCPICSKVFEYKNGMVSHIRNSHPNEYIKHSRKDDIKLVKLTCPICGTITGDMKQHVKKHRCFDWTMFCDEYNWDIKLTKGITDEYREKLSINKKNYYQSEEGIIRRQKQSKMYSGDNNPAKNRKTKEKSMFNRASRGNQVCVESPIGIKVNYDGYTFRSYNEFFFYMCCKLKNIKLIYEPNGWCVKWYNTKKGFITTYLPDFYRVDTGELIELKSTKREAANSLKEEKYIKVSNIYKNINKKYTIDYPKNYFMGAVGITNDDWIRLSMEVNNFIREEIGNNLVIFHLPKIHSKVIEDLLDDDYLIDKPFIIFNKNIKEKYGI